MTLSEEKGRRKHDRVLFSTRILLSFKNSENIDVTGNSKDLSLNGIFVDTDQTLEPDTPCVIVIVLSGGIEDVKLHINARVARVEAHGMGIIFDTMDLDSYTHLKNIVRYNSIKDL